MLAVSPAPTVGRIQNISGLDNQEMKSYGTRKSGFKSSPAELAVQLKIVCMLRWSCCEYWREQVKCLSGAVDWIEGDLLNFPRSPRGQSFCMFMFHFHGTWGPFSVRQANVK